MQHRPYGWMYGDEPDQDAHVRDYRRLRVDAESPFYGKGDNVVDTQPVQFIEVTPAGAFASSKMAEGFVTTAEGNRENTMTEPIGKTDAEKVKEACDRTARRFDEIVSTEPEETWWRCPECGWLMTPTAFLSASANFPCGRCGKTTLSAFNLTTNPLRYERPASTTAADIVPTDPDPTT